MSKFALFVALTFFVGCNAADDNVEGTLVIPPIRSSAVQKITTDANNICTTTKVSCKDQCSKDESIRKTILLCSENQAPVALSCQSDMPYCTEDADGKVACSNTESVSCGTQFKCPGEKSTYPDPKNCASYYICGSKQKDNTIPVAQMICPNEYTYEHLDGKGNCKRKRLSSDCVKFDCSKTTNMGVPYPANPNIYSFCINGQPVLLGQCPINEEFDGNKCKFTCKKEGNFKKGNACGKSYYSCTRGALFSFILATKECSPSLTDFNFNPATGNCDFFACPAPTV